MTDSMNYRASGVDIEAGNELVDRIRPIAKRTHRPGVLTGLGGFAGLFELPLERYQHPVLVASTDGVGTKLKLAMALQCHSTIGVDLVAMCANDLVVQGAEPLFFLDYYATGHLEVDIAAEVIEGIGQGCEQAGMSLIGGETAEMPGMYSGGEYDIAGFCVGIVEKDKIITGQTIEPGNALIAIASSGPHSNGYSLIRKVLERHQSDLDKPFGKMTLGETLLMPTRIYVRALLTLFSKVNVRGLAHITGGGFLENIPRILPKHTQATIDTHSWEWPEIFRWLQSKGNVPMKEMVRTFNCGVGMVLAVAEEDVKETIAILHDCGEESWVVGSVDASESEQPQVVLLS